MNDPGPTTPDRSRRIFFVILTAVLVMRLSVIAGSQRWLHWDECIIGLAAKDVLAGVLEVYFPGQAYGGGACVESVLIAPLYLVFGVSALAVKLYALIVSMATLGLIGLLVRRVWGFTAANWAMALWATAPGLAIFSLQVRAGYIEIQLLAAALLYLFHLGFGRAGGRWIHGFGLGLVAGLAYYNFALALPLILAVVVVAFVQDKLFFLRGRWLAALAGLLVGLGPMIWYDLTHEFAHVKWILQGRAEGTGLTLERVWRAFSFELPSFFQHDVDDFFAVVPWYAWGFMALTGVLVLLWIVHARGEIRAFTRQVVRGPTPTPWPPCLHVTMLLFAVTYLALYLLGPPHSPRYFLGLFPMLAIGAGVATAAAVASDRAALRIVGGGAAAALVLGGLIVNVHLMNLPGARRVLGEAKLREYKVRTDPAGAVQVRDWLLARDIRIAFAHPAVRWKLKFYSNEEIRASALFATYSDDYKDPENFEAVGEGLGRSEKYAFVFHHDFAYQGPEGGKVAGVGVVAIKGPDRNFVSGWLQEVIRRSVVGPWPPSIPRPEGLKPWIVTYREFVLTALRQAKVPYETTRVGDYLILHGFRDGAAVQVLGNCFTPFRMITRGQ